LVRRILRILLILIIIFAFILGAGTGYLIYTIRRPLPQTSGSITVQGLTGPVTIYRDNEGIPQIYADTPEDLFFAQGLVHAQDRWWQMEFNRHIGLGRISELTGKSESALNNDIFIRTAGWNRGAQDALDHAGKDSRNVLQAYANGVNAYISSKTGPDLALEYSVLAVRGINIPIEQWEPLHSVAWGKVMAWDLSDNLDMELDLAKLYKTVADHPELGITAADVDKVVASPYPDALPTILKADELPIKPDPVKAYNVPVVAPSTDLSHVQTQLVGEVPSDFSVSGGKDAGFGSNNWVIGGLRTQSGKPLMANDPHLGIRLPSIWYQVGLHCNQLSASCPYDVVGFGFAGVPGVVIGHNSRIAWAVTNATVDTQDLYMIKVNPNDDTEYEVDGKTEKMQVITETINIGGSKESKEIRIRMTRFGPIITDTPDFKDASSVPLALNWVALKEPSDLLGAVLALDRASDWTTFRAALTGWGMPSQNFIYADTEGNIGYQQPGLMPIRAKGHSGLTPVDGSTSQYDWKGYVPFEYLPHVYNPSRGYIATANNIAVPLDYYTQLAQSLGDQFGADSNYNYQLLADWGYRGKRIEDMILATDKHTVDTVKAIQTDTYDGFAAQMVPELVKLDYGADLPKDVIDWFGQWDYQDNMNSGQAALFAELWTQLAGSLWGDQLGYKPDGAMIKWVTASLLNEPNSIWWDDATTPSKKETRDDILKAALINAYKVVGKTLGSDYKAWKWGNMHTATFVSTPLGASGIGPIEALVNAGPVAVSGSTETIYRTSWNATRGYAVRSISSMRIIMDLSDFNASQWINSAGASGHPASSLYRSMIDQWRLGTYNPMLWDKATIEKACTATLTLNNK
jgi:penicillin G amidase